jgi:hypothetical protein
LATAIFWLVFGFFLAKFKCQQDFLPAASSASHLNARPVPSCLWFRRSFARKTTLRRSGVATALALECLSQSQPSEQNAKPSPPPPKQAKKTLSLRESQRYNKITSTMPDSHTDTEVLDAINEERVADAWKLIKAGAPWLTARDLVRSLQSEFRLRKNLPHLHTPSANLLQQPQHTASASHVSLNPPPPTTTSRRQNYGATVLHGAAQCGEEELAAHFVAGGMDVNVADTSGDTPMHWVGMCS